MFGSIGLRPPVFFVSRALPIVCVVGLSVSVHAQSSLGDLVEENAMSPALQAQAIQNHNAVRSDLALGNTVDDGTDGTYPTASNLRPMQWNQTLADVAQAYANQCIWEHNASRTADYAELTGEPNVYLGENIFYRGTTQANATKSTQLANGITSMAEEAFDWHYQTYSSATINGAGHFTQLVWQDSVEVGCGYSVCFDGQFYSHFVVCDYLAGANYVGQYPYETGPTCSACEDNEECVQGLCTLIAPNDAGTPEDDAGTPPEDDAGAPPEDDAGAPDDDAGNPPEDDAGNPPEDDAGNPPEDDAGAPDEDAGPPPEDDAGAPDEDAGPAPEDDPGADACACVTTASGSLPLALALLPFALVLLRRRREPGHAKTRA